MKLFGPVGPFFLVMGLRVFATLDPVLGSPQVPDSETVFRPFLFKSYYTDTDLGPRCGPRFFFEK